METAAQPASEGGIFSRLTKLFGTAVEAARSSEGIFTSFFLVLFLFLCFVGKCPVDTKHANA